MNEEQDFNLLNDFIDMASSEVDHKTLWREKPVSLMEFFTDYLREKPFPGKQTELIEVVNQILWFKLTGDKALCKESLRKVTELAVLFGKGSGKDFLISCILTYICYLLCCMNDPHTYLEFGQDEPIDLINVATNANQAYNVFFKKFIARLKNCKWFKKCKNRPKAYNEYQVTRNEIRFYKNITAHSAHSEASAYEGFSPLIAIFDEIGEFRIEDAEHCYSTIRSSSVTRYNDKTLLIFISFPRSENDFIMSKYKEYEENLDGQIYGMIGKSWEVNPRMRRDSLEKDYRRNPELAKLRYECIPPKYTDGLFKFPERIDGCVEVGKSSSCPNLVVEEIITTRTIHGGHEKHFVGLKLHNLNLDPKYTYYLGGDAAYISDSYILTLNHAEPTTVREIVNGQEVVKIVNKPVEDLILEWRPNKADRLPVDLINVADIIEMICSQVFVKKALFDKFNSAETIQRLLCYGVDAEDKNWSNPFQMQIFDNLKALIYTDQISLLDYKSRYEDEGVLSPCEELKHLKVINGQKIDHDKDKAKDFSDARAAAAWICSMDEPESQEHFSMPVIKGIKFKK